jgi:dienelactone hydrolase
MKHTFSTWIATLTTVIATASAFAASEPKMVSYGDSQFEGVLFAPLGAAKIKNTKPAILMIHNWMGITEETKTQAMRFADLGYTVFAADIYGKGIRPKDATEAGALATKYKTDRKLFRERLNLALKTLNQTPGVNPARVVVMGYCFGGTGAIELARSGAKLKGAVSFHGGLDSPTPADGAKIKARILAHHGAIDPYVKAEDLAAFEAEMKTNKVALELIRYPGAVHSFTEKAAGNDISKGAAYNADADAQSFESTKKFLAQIK